MILPAGQLPLPRTLPGCGAPAPGAPTAPLQDAVEGIAGLMQRFEQMQPQIATLPPAELQQVAEPAQRLHERFEAMQQKLMTRSGGPDLEEDAWSHPFVASVGQSPVLATAFFIQQLRKPLCFTETWPFLWTRSHPGWFLAFML